MLEQRIRNRQPDALRGAGLILLIALAVLAGSAFFTRLEPSIGTLSSVGFIAYGCAIAWFLLDWYVMGFIYTANADCLRVCRFYGKRERFMTDVWLNQVQGYGSPEDVKQRFPGARVSNATRSQCDLEPFAMAYLENGKTVILVLQPDEALRAHLLSVLRGKDKKPGKGGAAESAAAADREKQDDGEGNA